MWFILKLRHMQARDYDGASDELWLKGLRVKALMNQAQLATDRQILLRFGRHPKASTII